MPEPQPQWQVLPPPEVPKTFVEAVRRNAPSVDGRYAAQLLWQRGIRDEAQLPGYLNADCYLPASAFEFGEEMEWAVKRLQQAHQGGEKVAIWGDFDADGITATSVLWEGLGQFFSQQSQLIYTIPNRLTESHGLNIPGIDSLAAKGVQLIVTCDTGSTNLTEIEYANGLGIDVIITDHHTLPSKRPPVMAIINPRSLAETHPLHSLSGVAVAYKLVEALYETLPHIPQQPLSQLLDLVAIGLIADLVELRGDCRYLAQRGIEQLQQQTKSPTRPGVAALLKLCQRSGDRPTDISFGIGPRINAVSRIQGDASFCVELLTSKDEKRCSQLALETELANTRRKELQKGVLQQAKQQLELIDLSTTNVIVLVDSQWPGGVLGLVAGQIAQEYGHPTILLSTGEESDSLARGSARSVSNIDLYELVKSQEHLLHRFGGHPFAAGLSLPTENIPLFTEAINQQLRQRLRNSTGMFPTVTADLVVTVAELGRELFQELKLLEPCGMGNPAPKLLIKDCWFTDVWNQNPKDLSGKKVFYIKTTFNIWDESAKFGFPGLWWGHYKEDVPENQKCDVIAELDYNTFNHRYEIRLIAVKTSVETDSIRHGMFEKTEILDYRQSNLFDVNLENCVLLEDCPISWRELRIGLRKAIATNQKLALAYSNPPKPNPETVWKQLVGIAKYLSRTGKTATLPQLLAKLGLGLVDEKTEAISKLLKLGFDALHNLGFEVTLIEESLVAIHRNIPEKDRQNEKLRDAIAAFISAVEEEQFRRSYFYHIPLDTLQGIVTESV
ncbi:MAG: single-stranded-DNA-specific exonuclease RecJ [Chroococcales cyanobacterium]